MAAKHEQEIARDIIVTWLTRHDVGGAEIGTRIGDIYKTIVRAIHETSAEDFK
jgi:hypothetical protein